MADRRLLAVVGFIAQAPVIRKILNDVPGWIRMPFRRAPRCGILS
jgi:hypothetical protein